MRHFFIFSFLLSAGLVSAQSGVSLQVKALRQPGVYARGSALHYQERFLPAVPALTSPAGTAEVTFRLPPSSWALTFSDIFLQWIQASAANRLGIQTSDAAGLAAG